MIDAGLLPGCADLKRQAVRAATVRGNHGQPPTLTAAMFVNTERQPVLVWTHVLVANAAPASQHFSGCMSALA